MSQSEHTESSSSTADQQLNGCDSRRTAQPAAAALFQFNSGLASTHKPSAPANGDIDREQEDADLDLLLQPDSFKLGHVRERSSAIGGPLHSARTAPNTVAPCPKTENMQPSTAQNGDTTTDNLDQILDELLD